MCTEIPLGKARGRACGWEGLEAGLCAAFQKLVAEIKGQRCRRPEAGPGCSARSWWPHGKWRPAEAGLPWKCHSAWTEAALTGVTKGSPYVAGLHEPRKGEGYSCGGHRGPPALGGPGNRASNVTGPPVLLLWQPHLSPHPRPP